jgi:predicted nucleotidyltransferase
MLNTYGISDEIWKMILSTCFSYPQVTQVILYGSRAREDYRQGSDIDIAIDAPLMTINEFSTLWNALDDLPLIFSLDIVHLQTLKNKHLIQAIHEDGVSFKRDV